MKSARRDKEKLKREWKEMMIDLIDPSSDSEQKLYDESQEGTSVIFEQKVKGKYRMEFAKVSIALYFMKIYLSTSSLIEQW